MHACRDDKIARMLKRVPSEQEITTIALVDLSTKQNEHYPLSYIKPVASKSWVSIAFLSILLRPCYGPFCVGTDLNFAASNQKSWTRGNEVRNLLESYLTSLCLFRYTRLLRNLLVDFQGSSLYRLGSVYSLQASDVHCGRHRRLVNCS